jgi:antitoxin VapB
MEPIVKERHVRLFRNGRNQAIRIPREFEFKGKEAIIRKEGNKLIIEEPEKINLIALLDSLEPLNEAFSDDDKDLLPLDDIAL